MEKKNYYDWLEISKNASTEVIDKAYKALVKKYHPDLQEGENKLKAEEIIKHINEAYAILSDETKRKQYDGTIKEETISREDYDRLQEELNTMKRQSATTNHQVNYQNYNVNNNTNYNTNDNTNDNISNENSQSIERKRQELEYQQQLENARRKAYHDAYIQELKSRGYRIRYKKTFKDYLRVFIVILVIIICCIIIWMIPFTREKLIEFYQSNEVIKWIVDMIINIFKSLFNIQ